MMGPVYIFCKNCHYRFNCPILLNQTHEAGLREWKKIVSEKFMDRVIMISSAEVVKCLCIKDDPNGDTPVIHTEQELAGRDVIFDKEFVSLFLKDAL